MVFFFGFFNHLIYEQTIKMPKKFTLNKSFTSSLLVGFCQTHIFFPFPWLFSLFNILWIIYIWFFPATCCFVDLLMCSHHCWTIFGGITWTLHIDPIHVACDIWQPCIHVLRQISILLYVRRYVLWTNFNKKDVGLLLYKNVMNQFPSHIPYWCFWNSKWYNVIFPTFVPLHIC